MKQIPAHMKNLVFAGLMAAATAITTPPVVSAQTEEEPTAEPAAVVNINTATEEELMTLPGVGPSRAQAIVRQREQRPFQRVEDIMRVRGIGRATFRRLRPLLTVQ